MQPQNTYKKSTLTKIFFALTFLISLPFYSGYAGYSGFPPQQKAKTELVVSHKVKTPDWIKSSYKKVNQKTLTKALPSKNYETGFLFAYNKLTEVKFDNLSRKHSLIKSPGIFFRAKTIPHSSKENDFNSFAG